MKRALLITSLTGLMSIAVVAQNREEVERKLAVLTAELQAQAQAGTWTRAAVETRVTRGKPYSGEAVTEFVQILGDGNRIVRRSSARLSRDGEGRTRREENSEGAAAEKNSVVITDPVAGTSLILNPETRTAFKSPAMFARVQGSMAVFSSGAAAAQVEGLPPKVEIITIPSGEARARTEAEAAQVVVAGRGGRGGGGGPTTFTVTGRGGAMTSLNEAVGESTKQDLGQQTIEGVTANGSRTTTVIPAGAIGNEQPITIVSEQWFSPDLEMLVLTQHSDPRVGETTYRLTNITRSEPDRALFQVPSDYTIQEGRRVAPLPPPPPPPPPPVH
jgi:hypothetical protein